MVGRETSPSVLHSEQGKDGGPVTNKNTPSILHLEQGRELGAIVKVGLSW